jgi:hypothetical protein
VANRLSLEANPNVRPWRKPWVLVSESRECLIFQWGLTDTLSAIWECGRLSGRSGEGFTLG